MTQHSPIIGQPLPGAEHWICVDAFGKKPLEYQVNPLVHNNGEYMAVDPLDFAVRPAPRNLPAAKGMWVVFHKGHPIKGAKMPKQTLPKPGRPLHTNPTVRLFRTPLQAANAADLLRFMRD